VLEQLYNIINGRYENERSIVFTCDLTGEDENAPIDPARLAAHVTMRNFSRLMEMCGDPLRLMGDDNRRTQYRRPAYDEVA
jgi:DNA replication protein DnaC